jgi:class 3 adenylate cyclase
VTDKKHIDELVAERHRRQSELVSLGAEIASSARPIVVAFVDLADSTALKHERKPEEWLAYVFDFVQIVDQVATTSGGTIVKRIGDELMITFENVTASETFMDAAATQGALISYKYKIAVDYGDAYHFRFVDHLADDPYGPVVDRCARIAKLVSAGSVLTTRDYVAQITNPSDYIVVGQFSLKGVPGLQELFVRSIVDANAEEYLAPLLTILNSQARNLAGYRFTGRTFSVSDLRNFGGTPARPFIARELLNVPRLPLTLPQLAAVLSDASYSTEKELEFYGYFVEWTASFESFERGERDITVTLRDPEAVIYSRIKLLLPLNYLEIAKQLTKGQTIRARGDHHANPHLDRAKLRRLRRASARRRLTRARSCHGPALARQPSCLVNIQE